MYNYVFFWSPEDYYEYAFRDIIYLNNVKFIRGIPNSLNFFLKFIHKIHHSSKINNLLKLPARNIWKNIYFKNNFNNNNPIVFIFHGSYYWMKSIDYFQYLKSKYSNSKCVLLLMDTVDSYDKYFKNKYYGNFEIDYIKNNFDIIYSYNAIDAEKYGFEYYQSIYSVVDIKRKKEPLNDVFFVGKAKDRLDKIHSIYEQLVKADFKCDFYITNVPKERRIKDSTIHYNSKLTYDEIIHHIENSRGILEVIQGGTDGFTFRLDEALCYDKNIITNNSVINKIKYCNSKKIYFFEDNIDINLEEYRKMYNETYNYGNDYSPIAFLNNLENTI